MESRIKRDYGSFKRTNYITATIGISILVGSLIALMGIYALIVELVLIALTSVQRLKNIGAPRKLAAFIVIPFIGFVVHGFCFIAPQGWAQTKRIDGKGMFLTFIFLIKIIILYYFYIQLSINFDYF